MMHSNSFVLAIKDQAHRVLREIAGKVYLPFNSEYSLLLKNNNSVRASCEVSIDGTDVLGGRELILNPNSSLDLERFLVDGDLNKGNRFKLVPLTDGRVSDPSSPENGLIEVKFWKEKYRYMNCYIPNTFQPWDFKPWQSPYNAPITWCCSNNAGEQAKGINAMSNADHAYFANLASSSAQPGATVEGSISSQSFTLSSFGEKDGEPTVIRLQLMGRNEPVTVEKTKHIYCHVCSKSNPYSHKFCCRCGAKLCKTVEV